MNLTELIMRRRSIRKFTADAVSESDIAELKRVALCSPTSKNCKSWEFVFVTDTEIIKSLSASKEAGSAFMEQAPLAIVIFGDTDKTDVWVEDASIAAAFIQLKAEELGLGSCWVQMRERGFADGRKADTIIRELLGAPANLSVECVIAIGHKDQQRNPYVEEKLPYDHIHINKF